MDGRRVVITGAGVVTARGSGLDAFAVARQTPAPAGQAHPLEPVSLRCHPRVGDTVSRAAVDAADQAWRRAGLVTITQWPEDIAERPHDIAQRAPEIAQPSDQVAVLLGIGLAGLRASERATADAAAGRVPRPQDLLALSPAEPVAAVARRLGATGLCRGVATSCASGLDAIADAARLVAGGGIDLALAGATEAGATAVNLAGLRRLGVLSPTGVARPFDTGRDGLVLAEAAAALVVEDADHAERRGAVPMAVVLGAASTRDPGGHAAAIGADGSGVARCMRAAMTDAGVTSDELSAVVAHATGTRTGDEAEARGLRRALGSAAVPVTAGKGSTGHAMAAAGALGAVEGILALCDRRLAAVTGLREVAAEARGLDLVTVERPIGPGPVLVLAVGFGGFIAALVLGPA